MQLRAMWKVADGSAALEELNPYKFFDTASLYVGRIVDPHQARAVITTAIMTAMLEKGSTVISLPGRCRGDRCAVRRLCSCGTCYTGASSCG